MKYILAISLFLCGVVRAAEPQKIYVSVDKSVRGPFTDSPLVSTGETVIVLTDEQFSALCAFRNSNPGAGVAFDGTAFSLSAAEVAKRQAVTDRDALAAKLEAGTITAAEQRALIKAILSRIQKLELR